MKSNDESERAVEAGDVGSGRAPPRKRIVSGTKGSRSPSVRPAAARPGHPVKSCTGAVLVALGAIVVIVGLTATTTRRYSCFPCPTASSHSGWPYRPAIQVSWSSGNRPSWVLALTVSRP